MSSSDMPSRPEQASRRRESYYDTHSRPAHQSRRRSSANRDRPRRSSDADGTRRSSDATRVRRSSQHRSQDETRDSHGQHRRRRSSSNHHQSSGRYTSEKPRGVDAHDHAIQSPTAIPGDRDPMMHASRPSQGGVEDLSRKRSMIRPERRRDDPDDPNHYYRKHAQHMNVMPSITGNDPHLEDDFATASSRSGHSGDTRSGTSPQNEKGPAPSDLASRSASKRQPKKLARKSTVAADEKRRQKIKEASGTPTLWGTYCHMITFFIPNIVLGCFGMPKKEQQRAWREKIGLVSIILLIATFVGFLTFGFTQVVCPGGGPDRLQVNKVDLGYMIFHGKAYDLTRSKHPLARGISSGGNVLWDMDEPHGGQDGSFLFQNVNGKCKGLIEPAENSDVPTDSDGNLAWYFPCNTFNQDGSSSPNTTAGYYLGYSCHTSREARDGFYDLTSSGDVYFTWDDIRNSSRNLMVYSGDVLDLDLLEWFNTSQVSYPQIFDDIRTNAAVRGQDNTLAFASSSKKQVAQCLQEIVKVGSIDTETVGCIASKVVLYVSLIFIMAIVGAKFALALIFQWFLCRKYAADKTSMTSDKKKRQNQIEDWSEDIYRAPPKITDPASTVSGNSNKRNSFLPQTSRFTSPYAIETKSRPAPMTMASQSSTTRLIPPSNIGADGFTGSNRSEGTIPTIDSPGRGSVSHNRSSLMPSGAQSQRFSGMHGESEGSGPQGFIHESVVPQPPPDWQPFGYPLAHTICLITAYSEGPEGMRTTMDSIAMTDYPNSHKLLFVVCDGLIKGKGESMSTPEVCLAMMKDYTTQPDDVQPFSYVAVASGSKRHNMAKVYSGFYDYGADSAIPLERQQRVPMLLIVKCGTPEEATVSKPGNRGKRDSQIILMSFLQKVMFDERMTELEYEMFNGIWKITGISPDFYEITLMVDADTKVFPDSLTHMVSAMVKDPEVMGLCGETKIANKTDSWVTMIQVFEYFISHHLSKSFESVFGGVTCLPGCFCMYRIKTPKGGQNYWVPILANPDIVEHYSENVVDTLHKKNLLLLGEDRYLSTLMLKTFPKRKQIFVPQAVCKTTVPDEFKVLLSQRRRWINSTVHNLMELVLVRDLCGTFCFSMQFVVFIELIGTLVLPAAIAFTLYVVALGLKSAFTDTPTPTIPLILLVLILGLPGVLIVITAHRFVYVLWMLIYLLSLPIWNFILPTYSFWHFDDFSWGDTRQTAGAVAGADKSGHDEDGEFDSSKITMKRWGDFEQERRFRAPVWSGNGNGSGRPKSQGLSTMGGASSYVTTPMLGGHERSGSRGGSRGFESVYRD